MSGKTFYVSLEKNVYASKEISLNLKHFPRFRFKTIYTVKYTCKRNVYLFHILQRYVQVAALALERRGSFGSIAPGPAA